MKRLSSLAVALVGVAGLVAFLVLMGSLIYPGALEWTAGSVCPDDKPDSVVVRDTYSPQPGETTTNFTLYCMGPRGETEDAGFGKPVGILILWGVGLAGLLVVAIWLIGGLRRLLGRSSSGEGGGGPGDGSDSLRSTTASDPTGTVAAPIEDYGGQPPLIT